MAARLTIEIDLEEYRDTLDRSLHLHRVEEDITDAFQRAHLASGTLSTKVEIRRYDKRTGTLTIDMEAP